MKVGISTGTFYPSFNTLDALQQVAEAGFRYAEVVLQGSEEHDLSFARRVTCQCAKLNIRVSALHPRAELFRNDDYSISSELFQTALLIAKEIGANILVFHGPVRSADVNVNRVVTANLCQMAKFTQEQGLLLTLENTLNGLCKTPEDMTAIFQEENSSSLGVTLDLFKSLAAGYSIEDFILTLAKHIYHFHFCDQSPQRAGRLVPGQGNLRLTEILSQMAVVLPNGTAVLEAQGVKDAALLRDFSQWLSTLGE